MVRVQDRGAPLLPPQYLCLNLPKHVIRDISILCACVHALSQDTDIHSSNIKSSKLAGNIKGTEYETSARLYPNKNHRAGVDRSQNPVDPH